MQVTDQQCEELWNSKCSSSLANLDSMMKSKVMASLINITRLRMILTIASRDWWEEVFTVVTWLYRSRQSGVADIRCDMSATNIHSLHHACWYLFGKDRCQIGKTIVVAVMCVVQKDSRSVAFTLTNLRTHVDDVAQKTRQYLEEGEPGRWQTSFYTVETLAGHTGKKYLQQLPQMIRNNLLICSWRSKYQLDTLAALRFNMIHKSATLGQAIPFIAADEWDLTKTSRREDSAQERARHAVLGLRQGQILSRSKWEHILGQPAQHSTFYLPQALAVVVMTSTPEGLLHDMVEKGLQLAGWCAPKPYKAFLGMEAWRVHPYDADCLEAAHRYCRECLSLVTFSKSAIVKTLLT